MTTDLLFEHFDTLATAPEGIARLREMILQLAVQGKLGTQDERDEPANMLLDRIRKEKERLVKEGKIKREKPLDPINIIKAPHNLPKSWVIAYLNEVCELVADPDHNMPKAREHGTKFISAKDLRDDGTINFEINVKCISDEDYSRLARKIQPKFGDIIFSRIGSIGKSCIVKTNEKFMISYSCCVIRPMMVDTNYLNYFLKEASFLTVALEKTQGIGVPDLGMKMIKQFIVPLPPLAEQHRIVEKVDRLMALCDDLEARQQQEREGCLKLGKASLAGLQNAKSPEEFERLWAQVCDAFDLILDSPENVEVLRQTILQLAVRGKLGTQDERDETANILSSKIIQKRKQLIDDRSIFKSRTLPGIEPEEIPFQIPESWVWLRLDDIGHNWGQKEPDNTFTYIDVTAINKEKGLIGDDANILRPEEAPSRARKIVRKGTVIYSTVRPYLLNIAIVNKDFNPEPIVSTAFAVLHPFEGISNRYLFHYLRSKPFIEYVESQMTGMAYPAINDVKFHMGLIPVPPLAEQHRIVKKVDAMLDLCNQFEVRLKERTEVQERLTGAIIRQVAGLVQ